MRDNILKKIFWLLWHANKLWATKIGILVYLALQLISRGGLIVFLFCCHQMFMSLFGSPKSNQKALDAERRFCARDRRKPRLKLPSAYASEEAIFPLSLPGINPPIINLLHFSNLFLIFYHIPFGEFFEDDITENRPHFIWFFMRNKLR